MKAVSSFTLVLILVAAALGAKLYLDQREMSLDYPLHRTLTSNDGRTLDVVIHGKTESAIVIERLSDGNTFHLDVANLSAEDRALAESLPINRKTTRAERPQSSSQPGNHKDSYVQNRLDKIEELRSKLADLTKEINSGKLNSMMLNNRIDERERIEAEIKELQTAIRDYKSPSRID